jgi:hypothetical protein
MRIIADLTAFGGFSDISLNMLITIIGPRWIVRTPDEQVKKHHYASRSSDAANHLK